MDINIVRFLTERELGHSSVKIASGEGKMQKTGDISQQLAEDKATIPTKNQACEFSGMTRATFLMTFSPDGSKMASTHGDHNVRITDLNSGKCLHTLKGHPRTPWCVAFHPVSNDILASGCLGGEVRIWDLRGGGSEVWRSEKNHMGITSMAFHPSDQVLVFSVANEIHFWDWTEPEPFATAVTKYEYEKVRWVRFDPHGYHLYTGIGNGVSVQQTESQQNNESNRGSGSQHVSETHANLQNQYCRILEEINQLRRDRLQNELSGGSMIRRPYSLLSTSRSSQLAASETASSQSVQRRPPSPAHVDSLVSARIYASAVTRAQQNRDQPSSISHTTSQAPSAGIDSRSITPRAPTLQRNLLETASNPPEQDNPAVTLTGTNDSNQRNSTSISNSHGTGLSSMAMLSNIPSHAASRLSNFLRSRLTSVASSSDSQHISLSGVSGITSSAQLPSSTTLLRQQSNIVQPITIIPSQTIAETSVSRVPSLEPTALRSSLSSRLASAFQAQFRNSSARTSTAPSSSATSTATSESVRGRFISYLNSRARSGNSGEHFQCETGRCQVCENYNSMNRWSEQGQMSQTVPVVPRRVSRSTNGREGPSSTGTSQNSHKLVGMLESELRQALDQVRARRMDISETLRDLGSLRQELDMHHCTPTSTAPSATEASQPSTSTSASVAVRRESSSDDGATNIMETDDSVTSPEAVSSIPEAPPITPLPEVSFSGNQPEDANDSDDNTTANAIPDPIQLLTDQPETSTAESDVIEEEVFSQGSSSSSSSIGSLDSLPSSQESQSSEDSDPTLAAIGNYSVEIERRVHDLDRRILDIQSRLQQRLERLQQQREQSQRVTSSSIPRCVSVSERIRQRHERLRGRLQDLRRKYQNRIRNSASASESHASRVHTEHERSHGKNRERNRHSARKSCVRRETDRQNLEATEAGTSRSEPEQQRDSAEGSSINRSSAARRQNVPSIANIRAQMLRSVHRERERERSLHLLQRRHLHPHYSVSILDDTVNRPDDGLQAAINRAIAGAFIAAGENNVASNIVNASFRIQRWEFSRGNIPNITSSSENVIVPQCKLHNDSYCDVSQDGRYLAVFVPSHRGFPDDSILAVFSLAPENFKQCLFTKSFGPNFVSVSISPLNNYLLVGLATRRLTWVYTPRQMIAQVYKMASAKAGEESMEHVCDLMHPCDMDVRAPVSVNSARWLPYVGEGIVYGTNRGDLHICRPGFEQEEKRNYTDQQTEPHQMRPSWFMNMLGMNVPRTTNTSTQTTQGVRRTASTQTEIIESEDST